MLSHEQGSSFKELLELWSGVLGPQILQPLCPTDDRSLFTGMENPMPERPREKEEPVVREASEPVDCHLGDMLQQLHSVNASKPSERGLVRQGGHRARAPGVGREVSGPWLHSAFPSPFSCTLQPREVGLLAQALRGQASPFFL